MKVLENIFMPNKILKSKLEFGTAIEKYVDNINARKNRKLRNKSCNH